MVKRIRSLKDGRGKHSNSLNNLKLGTPSRYQGKERHNFTIMPETYKWLHFEKGRTHLNASSRVDELVAQAREGLIFTPDKREEILTSLNSILDLSESAAINKKVKALIKLFSF